jgi:hypothetical protein
MQEQEEAAQQKLQAAREHARTVLQEIKFVELATAIEAWEGGPPRHPDKEIKAQLDEMYDAIPEDCVKTAERKTWALNTWLIERARG